MFTFFRQLVFGVSNASRPDGGYDEPGEEELLANVPGLLDNPILLLYDDNPNRGVVVFALQDIPVNKSMVSEKGTCVLRSSRETVSVNSRNLSISKDALQEEDEIRRRQQEERDQQLKSQPSSSNDASSDAKKKAAEDARAKERAEEEAKRKTEQEAKKRAELETRVKAENEARAKAESDARSKAEAEARAKAETETRARALSDARKRAEEEARKKAEEDAKKRAEEEAKKAEDELKRKNEEEAKRKADTEETKKKEAEKKAEEEARKARQREEKLREEARLQEEEKKRIAEEQRKLEQERIQEEKRKKEEKDREINKAIEDAAKLLADEEAKRKTTAAEVKPKGHKRRKSDETIFLNQKRAHRLHHLTLTRAPLPQGRKLPTKPISEFPGLKVDVPKRSSRSFEESDLDELRAAASSEPVVEQSMSPPKKFVPPRGGMALPMGFDPSAIKSTLKRTPIKQDQDEEDASPSKPPPFGAKGFALPGMGDIGSIRLKKSAATPNKTDTTQSTTEQVDFRNMLKPAKK